MTALKYEMGRLVGAPAGPAPDPQTGTRRRDQALIAKPVVRVRKALTAIAVAGTVDEPLPVPFLAPRIRVDWFRDTGKWCAGCIIQLESGTQASDDIRQQLVDRQNTMAEGWQGGYQVLVVDHPDDARSGQYTHFFTRLYAAERFVGFKQQAIGE